ncbi:MAG: hypothetical protein IJ125_08460 [Atopobiaceae bacterium]|nr:hypothetical protein [Atopobiaceae bacterium]
MGNWKLSGVNRSSLVQLQRICIDDSDGFFSDALNDVITHLNLAFELGDSTQRRRLLEVLNDFAEENPGKDRGNIYWFEQDIIDEFLAERFSQDAKFAPSMIELANERLSAFKDAMLHMNYANNRRAYRGVAANLAHAASLPGGLEPAQNAASSIRDEYPRRYALLDELRSAGFVV